MRSWRTSLLAVASAGFGFVLFSPDLFSHYPWIVQIAKYAMLGGLAGLGIAAKDATVHSTPDEVGEAGAREKEKLLNS